MKKSIWGVCALLLTACVAQRHSAVTSEAGKGKETIDSLAPNPFIRHIYTADPSAHVWADGRLYVYASHDIAPARGCDLMDQYHVFSTDDMVHWTDHGEILRASQVPWGRKEGGFMWAPDCAYKDGTYYFYFPHPSGTYTNDSWKIGVATSKEPAANFTVQGYIEGMDPLIDPCVFVDDDGQAYMYWGNPNLYYVKLNEDMISTSGDIVKIGKLKTYQEGPWFYKRNNHYYLAFASTCCPEGIGYAMSDSPTGPWDVKGYIMRPTDRTRGNHPGIIDYKGKTYVFGQNYDLLRLEMEEHHERRSISVAEMHYNADGTIQEVPYFKDVKVEQIEHFNPYRRVEAETMAWGHGLKTARLDDGGIYVTAVDDGDSLVVRGVDFGKRGAKRFRACIASEQGCAVEIHLDSAGGPLVGTLEVKATGGMQTYKEMECRVKGAKGVHDLVFLFKGSVGKDLMNWDYWCFN